jgi:hypothetical protein
MSRITQVSDTELLYRLPYTPDYYGNEKVKVVKHDDGTIEVDPKTTGLIDCRYKTDLERLKKHGGEVRAYMLAKNGATWGIQKGYVKKSDLLRSREQCIEEAKPGDHVYVVEAEMDDVSLGTSDFHAKEFDITGELDQEKDLNFTTGIIDCRSKADVEKLRKHIGSVRAYALQKRAKKAWPAGKLRSLKSGQRVTYREKCIADARPGDRAYIIESDYTELGAIHSEDFETSGGMITEELDPDKDLGFTKGTLLDLKTTADVEKLRKHVGPVRGYKYVTKDLKSPTRTGPEQITYVIGDEVKIKNANTDENSDCAEGINVAGQEWVEQHGSGAEYRRLAFEFDSADIAAIPVRQAGKLRVFRALCVEEVDRKWKPINPKPKKTEPPKPEIGIPVSGTATVGMPEAEKPKPIKAPVKPKKRKGFFDRLFGR